jgi:hypothetical protein
MKTSKQLRDAGHILPRCTSREGLERVGTGWDQTEVQDSLGYRRKILSTLAAHVVLVAAVVIAIVADVYDRQWHWVMAWEHGKGCYLEQPREQSH